MKAVLKGNIIALNTYIRKEEISKTSHLSFSFRKLENEEQIKSNINRRKEIIKIRTEINEIQNRKSREKINKT